MIGCDCLSVRVLLQPDVCVLAFPWLWPALHSPPQDFVGNTPAHPRALSLKVASPEAGPDPEHLRVLCFPHYFFLIEL